MLRPIAQRDVSQRPSAAAAPSAAEKLDRLLRNLALLALQETRASSAAIGLLRNHEVICRAVAGPPLAEVGAPINIESGLAAMAIEREMSQWCTDTETDARVNAGVCRQLGVRSLIIVPIRSVDEVVGILAVFSDTPDAFCRANLDSMNKLAQWAADAIDRTVRIVPPLPAALAAKPDAGSHPPLSQPTRGSRIAMYVAMAWRAILRSVFGRRKRPPLTLRLPAR